MDLNKDLKYIKKKYGEKMMHYCRECFPTILNVPGKLVEILNKHFYYVKDSLYNDIKENHKESEFNDFVYSNAGLKNEYDIRDVSKTPKELLDDAGYDLLYPNNIKKKVRKNISFANRGMDLETLINEANNYYLNDVNSGDSYVINIEFYGDKPAVNDYLYLSYPLTKEKILNIGPLTSECGNDILSEDDDDFVKLEHEGKITYLKRIYG